MNLILDDAEKERLLSILNGVKTSQSQYFIDKILVLDKSIQELNQTLFVTNEHYRNIIPPKQEEWLTIKDYPRYECSNFGKFRSLDNKEYKELKQRANHLGYLLVNLGKTVSTHRIVAKTFLPNPNNYPIVNHKDGNKQNNCISNLEWCTHEHNNRHAFVNNLRNDMIGGNNISAKLNLEKVRNIRKEYLVGNISFIELAKKYDVSFLTIRRIIKNKSWFDSNCDNEEYHTRVNKIIGTTRRKLIQIARGKLTMEDANKIRKLYFEEKNTSRELAKLFNISLNIILLIIKNKIWKNESYIVSNEQIEEIKRRNFIKKNVKIKEEDRNTIKKLYLDDYKQHEIAKIYNISQTRVSQIVLDKP